MFPTRDKQGNWPDSVIFNPQTQTHETTVDNITYEYDSAKNAWFPMYNEQLVKAQQSIYSVEGVDETEVIRPKRKQKKSIFEQEEKKPKITEPKPRKNTSVYVTGLPLDASFDEIKNQFQKYGILLEDFETGQPYILSLIKS
jgi:HIV Tat-specific factor 1